MARLVIFDETVRGVDLTEHTVILGRSRRVDIPIRDHLLSRKHCTIVPTAAGFRLIDLKSSNGTFVNGVRVERKELEFEDIIEVGNTVIVLLDTDTWERGKGLPRLRNPAKARELIKAIRKRLVSDKGPEMTGGAGEAVHGPSTALRQKMVLTPAESSLLSWLTEKGYDAPVSAKLLEGYLTYQLASLLIRYDKRLGEVLSSVMEKVLDKENFQGDFEKLQGAIHLHLEEALAVLQGEPEGSPSADEAGRTPEPQPVEGTLDKGDPSS